MIVASHSIRWKWRHQTTTDMYVLIVRRWSIYYIKADIINAVANTSKWESFSVRCLINWFISSLWRAFVVTFGIHHGLKYNNENKSKPFQHLYEETETIWWYSHIKHKIKENVTRVAKVAAFDMMMMVIRWATNISSGSPKFKRVSWTHTTPYVSKQTKKVIEIPVCVQSLGEITYEDDNGRE